MSPEIEETKETDDRVEELLRTHRGRIYGRILSLVPNHNDADDILQEVCSVLWLKRSDYQPGTNFAAWALTVTRFQVLAFLKTEKRRVNRFSHRAMDELQQDMSERTESDNESKTKALQRCLDQLGARDRELLKLRYTPSQDIEKIARLSKRTVGATYKALQRIHARVAKCARRTYSGESS